MAETGYQRDAVSRRGLAVLCGVLVITFAVVGAAAARPLAAPAITRVSPGSATVGATITISGRNLAGARVLFRSVRSRQVTVGAAGRQLKVVVPPGPAVGKAKLTVTTTGGTATATFTILPIP